MDDIGGTIEPPLGHVYATCSSRVRYPGTRVTSYYDWSAADPVRKEGGIFPVIPESALRATLGILARAAARAATPQPKDPNLRRCLRRPPAGTASLKMPPRQLWLTEVSWTCST